jgi:hypothetical protein
MNSRFTWDNHVACNCIRLNRKYFTNKNIFKYNFFFMKNIKNELLVNCISKMSAKKTKKKKLYKNSFISVTENCFLIKWDVMIMIRWTIFTILECSHLLMLQNVSSFQTNTKKAFCFIFEIIIIWNVSPKNLKMRQDRGTRINVYFLYGTRTIGFLAVCSPRISDQCVRQFSHYLLS